MAELYNKWDKGAGRKRWENPWGERLHKWQESVEERRAKEEATKSSKNDETIVTYYYFKKTGEMVKAVDQIKEDGEHNKFFYYGYLSDQYSTTGNFNAQQNQLNYHEIDPQSDLGFLYRTVYSEMGGKDEYSHLIVAETIRNRTSRPVGSSENPDGTYKGIIEAAYDVADSGNPRFDEFQNPHIHDSNEGERIALHRAVQQSIKAYFTNSNIALSGMFYNSNSSTIYDGNPQLEKVELAVVANGIKGVWRFKIQ
jgi:hypothetical protein